MKGLFSKEQKQWLEQNCQGKYLDEILMEFNGTWGTDITLNQLRGFNSNCRKQGIVFKTGKRCCRRVGYIWPLAVRNLIDSLASEFSNSEICKIIELDAGITCNNKQIQSYRAKKKIPPYKVWTDEAKKVLVENYQKMGCQELAELISRTCNRYVTRVKVTGQISYMKLPVQNPKKNHPGNHYRKVGDIRLRQSHRKDNYKGYYEIKVGEPNEWKLLSHYNWEKINGPVPKGYCLIYLDGNTLNCDVENLFLIKRNYHGLVNRYGTTNNPEERKTFAAMAALKYETKRRKEQCSTKTTKN